MRMRTARERRVHVLLAVSLIFGGLVLAIVNGSAPVYQVTPLVPSGSFFALAMGGNTLYAASANSGSILLQRSTDQGLQWTQSAVPYSLIASNTSSWNHAAVAVDGSTVVVTASSGGADVWFGPPVASDVRPYYECGEFENSTVLLATSFDGGSTWTSQTFPTSGVGVNSIQVGVQGNVAAVAWLGQTSSCSSSSYSSPEGTVGAITSLDGGLTWGTGIQNLTPSGAEVDPGQNLEMTESTQGIVLGFGSTSTSTGDSLLNLWRLDASGSSSQFESIYGTIPAPESWTLQGDSTTSAFLLTPAYLIPLGNGQLSGVPFSQLQEDSGSVAELPNVIAMVAQGESSVNVAATMEDGSGVDCWNVNLVDDAITQTCHVPLGSPLLPSDATYPIVALLYGNGYWAAIGAGAADDYLGGGVEAGTAASVGTSVCFSGCQSDAGLVGYTYEQGSAVSPVWATLVAVLLVLTGLVWLATTSRATKALGESAGSRQAPPPANPLPYGGGWTGLAKVRSTYLQGLLVWVIAWTPLTLIALSPGSSGADPLLPYAIILGGIFGILLMIPFMTRVRKHLLQGGHSVFTRTLVPPGYPGAGPVTASEDWTTVGLVWLSWLAIFGLLFFLWIFSLSTRVYEPMGSVGAEASSLSPLAVILAAMVLIVVLLRTLYHQGLGSAMMNLTRTPTPTLSAVPWSRSDVLRTRIGAALIPWNPFVGLILGWALQSTAQESPYLLAWVFLPLSLLGIAILGGCFGRTAWAPAAWA